MNGRRRVGVIGGTFDPIHVGHLAAARAAQQAVSLGAVIFVPSSQPPHRPDKPHASGYHRCQMAALAVAGVAGWSVSEIEVSRSGASYTFDTLTALKATDERSAFFFVLGADAFAEIATWSRYPAVLDLAHFVVIARTGTPLEPLRSPSGALAWRLAESPEAIDVQKPSIVLVEADTPAVSSTMIRGRAARGEPLAGLVPAPVEHYIRTHRLYLPEPGLEPPSPRSLDGTEC
jgi:nicotinate-nucleotide adenylyltransferase